MDRSENSLIQTCPLYKNSNFFNKAATLYSDPPHLAYIRKRCNECFQLHEPVCRIRYQRRIGLIEQGYIGDKLLEEVPLHPADEAPDFFEIFDFRKARNTGGTQFIVDAARFQQVEGFDYFGEVDISACEPGVFLRGRLDIDRHVIEEFFQ
jgi:hypothetical protein